MDASGKIWVALDCTKRQALEIAAAVGNHPAVGGFKVNRLVDEEVFRHDGDPRLFDELGRYGKCVWVDIKAHDVDRTVAGRFAPYVNSGLVTHITVHAKGGQAMMEAAVKAGGDKVQVIAVTELTSLTPDQIQELSGRTPEDSVKYLAGLSIAAGVRQVVCSTKEIAVVRADHQLICLELNVPGITPAWKYQSGGKPPSDQQRIGTPEAAFQAGANRIVLGSAIVEAKDPMQALLQTVAEIKAITLAAAA